MVWVCFSNPYGSSNNDRQTAQTSPHDTGYPRRNPQRNRYPGRTCGALQHQYSHHHEVEEPPLGSSRSHTAHRLQTTLTHAQERIAVELRKILKLGLDDLLVVVREFLNPSVSRSGLDRCLRRHGIGSLRDLEPAPAKRPGKPFKAYDPGYFRRQIFAANAGRNVPPLLVCRDRPGYALGVCADQAKQDSRCRPGVSERLAESGTVPYPDDPDRQWQ